MNFKIITDKKEYMVEFVPGQSILEAAQNAGVTGLRAACGGKGTCGKCQVLISEEGESYYELACMVQAKEGMTVTAKSHGKAVVAKRGINRAKVHVDSQAKGYGIACDIGTTTVALMLVDLSSGDVLETMGAANSQSSYGADVIARIVSANEGNLENLKKAINSQLNEMIKELAASQKVAISEIKKMTVAANPTMCHLFTGLSPRGIGVAPFVPESYFGEEYSSKHFGFEFEGSVYILPSVSGYVGGDITADMISCGVKNSEKKILLVDVGTNGEMLIGSKEGIMCCSTAAGPAFEGAQIRYGMTAKPGAISAVQYVDGELKIKTVGDVEAVGICGSGLIDAVAVMLSLGALDETGRILDPEEDEDELSEEALKYLFLDEDEEPCFRLSENVCIVPSDIRKLQLGKAAISAGIQVLISEMNADYDEISELLLAGGFGSYIRPESAAKIGLIPAELLQVTKAAGNTAIEGALAALLDETYKAELQQLKKDVQYFELSGKKEFTEYYVDNMMFE